MKFRETIAKNIKRFREAKGETQREFAKSINVGYSLVSNWESGLSSPNIDVLVTICNHLGITLAELYGISDEEQNRARDYFIAYNQAPENVRTAIDNLLKVQKEQSDPDPSEAKNEK